MIKTRVKILVITFCAVVGMLFLSTEFSGAKIETATGHADVGDEAWGKPCYANADGTPSAYCRWVAGVSCCDNGHGKLAKEGTASGDAQRGWDYDCTANDCPGEEDCNNSMEIELGGKKRGFGSGGGTPVLANP